MSRKTVKRHNFRGITRKKIRKRKSVSKRVSRKRVRGGVNKKNKKKTKRRLRRYQRGGTGQQLTLDLSEEQMTLVNTASFFPAGLLPQSLRSSTDLTPEQSSTLTSNLVNAIKYILGRIGLHTVGALISVSSTTGSGYRNLRYITRQAFTALGRRLARSRRLATIPGADTISIDNNSIEKANIEKLINPLTTYLTDFRGTNHMSHPGIVTGFYHISEKNGELNPNLYLFAVFDNSNNIDIRVIFKDSNLSGEDFYKHLQNILNTIESLNKDSLPALNDSEKSKLFELTTSTPMEEFPVFSENTTDNDCWLTDTVLGKGNFGKVVLSLTNGKSSDNTGNTWSLSATKIAKETMGGFGDLDNEQEIAVLIKDKSPNLVNIVETVNPTLIFESYEDNLKFLTFEFCELGSLLSGLQRGYIKADMVLPILEGIAAGLDDLNDLDIIHLDLACRNVLLTGTLSHPTPKIGDFGLSKKIRETFKPYPIPWKWTHPEIYREVKRLGGGGGAGAGPAELLKYNKKHDHWSLGVLIVECAAELDAYNTQTNNGYTKIGGSKAYLGSDNSVDPAEIIKYAYTICENVEEYHLGDVLNIETSILQLLLSDGTKEAKELLPELFEKTEDVTHQAPPVPPRPSLLPFYSSIKVSTSGITPFYSSVRTSPSPTVVDTDTDGYLVPFINETLTTTDAEESSGPPSPTPVAQPRMIGVSADEGFFSVSPISTPSPAPSFSNIFTVNGVLHSRQEDDDNEGYHYQMLQPIIESEKNILDKYSVVLSNKHEARVDGYSTSVISTSDRRSTWLSGGGQKGGAGSGLPYNVIEQLKFADLYGVRGRIPTIHITDTELNDEPEDAGKITIPKLYTKLIEGNKDTVGPNLQVILQKCTDYSDRKREEKIQQFISILTGAAGAAGEPTTPAKGAVTTTRPGETPGGIEKTSAAAAAARKSVAKTHRVYRAPSGPGR